MAELKGVFMARWVFTAVGVMVVLNVWKWVPAVAHAHTRWFAREPLPLVPPSEPVVMYVVGWAGIALVMLIGVWWLHHMRWCDRVLPLPHADPTDALRTFAVLLGSFLVLASSHNYVFAPPHHTAAGIPFFLVLAEFAVGILLLLRHTAALGGAALVGLWVLALPWIGVIGWLENMWVPASGLAVVVAGGVATPWSHLGIRLVDRARAWRPYALTLLRVGAGATLLVLGMSEKVLHPELGLSFLYQHPWNFMAHMGLPYSDTLFVISAGMVESLLGFLILVGWCVRLVAAVTLGFFALPIFLLGPIELAGHLPHFAALALLVFYGDRRCSS